MAKWYEINENTPLLGDFMADGRKETGAADEIMDGILADYENLTPPELEKLQLENPEWLEDLISQNQGDTEFGNIQGDPRYKETQDAALASLEELSDGGLTMSDKANLSRIESQSATADRGRREAIQQNAAMKGMSGGGNEMLAQLQSSQDATNLQAQQGLNVAGMAQDRALQAMMQSGQLAGDIRGQEYSENSQKASAQDAINRFNTGNTNTANQYNNQGRQNIHNTGVDNNNQANSYNTTELPQNQFNNQFDILNAQSGVKSDQAGRLYDKGNKDDARRAGAWDTAIRAGAAVYTGGASEGVRAGAEAAGQTKKKQAYQTRK